MLYNHPDPTVEAYLSGDQTGFRPERGCTEQIASLTMFIENSFKKGL